MNGWKAAKIFWLTCKYCGWQPPLASPKTMRAQIAAHIRTEHRQQETAQ